MKAKISNISEISSYFIEKEQTRSILTRLYKVLDLVTHLKSPSPSKSQGLPISQLMYGLLLMQIYGLSIYAGSKQDYWHLLSCQGKDTFYRFLNRATTNWRKLLYDVTRSFLSICALRGSGNQHQGPCCLIFDDTLLPKTGKNRKGSLRYMIMYVEKCAWGIDTYFAKKNITDSLSNDKQHFNKHGYYTKRCSA